MRDYAKIKPRFWTHGDGKALRGDDAARVLVTYLFSCPNSNMVGLYYIALPQMLGELGWDEDKLRENLAKPTVMALARYDFDEDLAYLPSGSHYQVSETLKPGDNNRKACVREVLPYADHPFAKDWVERYEDAYHLRAGTTKGHEDLLRCTKLEQWSKGLATDPVTHSGGVAEGSQGPLAKGSYPAPAPVPDLVSGGSGGSPPAALPPAEAPAPPPPPPPDLTRLAKFDPAELDPRAAAIAEELAIHDLTRHLDDDLVAWATRALAPVLTDGQVTPERCVEAIRIRLSNLGSDSTPERRRQVMSNAIRYIPDTLRKQRDQKRTETGRESETEHLERKKRIAAEDKRETNKHDRWRREAAEAEATKAEALRKLTSGVGTAGGGDRTRRQA
jgi:hypothetical protein